MLPGFVAAAGTMQETVFQCLQSWIRHVDVPGEEVARNPILSAAFDALEKVELHETAVDFLVEVRGSSTPSALRTWHLSCAWS